MTDAPEGQLAELQAENAKLIRWHREDGDALAGMCGTIERLRKERDAFRDQRNAVFATNEQLLAQVEEAGQARIRAENEARTAKREAAVPSAPADASWSAAMREAARLVGVYTGNTSDANAMMLARIAEGVPRDSDPTPTALQVSAPADQALRDRIEEAVKSVLPMASSMARALVANAVLTVLPAEPRRPFDAQVGLRRLADDLHRGEATGGATAPADRAAVLREAADVAECVAQKRHGQHEIEREQGALDVMAELRRMADEAQQLCVHPQGFEGECPCPPSCVCCTATAADEARQVIRPASDDYEAATGHAVTCGSGFGMGCQCAHEAQQAGEA
ncbi:hypothetical protein [Streptomyces sp. MZ04]|uniref:hypothetical protein n=1 Tax=Streptomyces sp. MZ04 TaxID=2559236 RepID=UPI00107EA4DB|nr:hypothetical protein [Streptomyces sp. MZ04]TGB06519.1 hypothetical protein E2651_23180 [Streptomyces sp. MZ04]